MLETKAFILTFAMVMNGPPEGIYVFDYKDLVAHRTEIYEWAKKEQIIDQNWWWENHMFKFEQWEGEEIEDQKEEEVYKTHLEGIYNTYHMMKNVPLLEEFPLHKYKIANHDLFTNLSRMNYKYQSYLEERIEWELDRKDVLEQALEETKFCKKVWSLISDLNSSYYGAGAKRLKYVELKQLLGKEWFSGPELFPYVPYWRFRTE